MARIRIQIPEKFSFSIIIPIRITDINYGGHVGNDTILSILHEARSRFFIHYGYSELNLAGVGTILSDVGIEFKNELFYGDILKAHVTAGDFSRVSFDLFYLLEKTNADGKSIPVVIAKTGIVTYDYSKKKVVPVPDEVLLKIAGQ
jgi:acyl-CoA thioesterase FadM